MDWFSGLIGACVLAVTVPFPAFAQSMPQLQPDLGVAAQDPGALADDVHAFLLIEHGVGGPPASSLFGSSIVQKPKVQASQRDDRRARSFRRLIYLPHVQAAEARFALPPGLLDALLWKESRYDPLAVSPAGAAGLGQLMPDTARELGVHNRFDPLTNLYAAGRYLRQQIDRFGTIHLALAAYNAGPNAVARAGGIPRNRETPGYVLDILRDWQGGRRRQF